MDNKTIEINNSFKKNFQVGEIYNHSELRKFLEENKLFSVKNVAAYSYNRWNKGMMEIHPLLEWINRGEYKYLGENYPYNGIVIHHPQAGIPYKIAEWVEGELTFFNDFISFKEWKESMYDGIKVVDLNSKVIFISEDGKIQQKKILTDTKDGEVVFEEGYSLTYFDSPLGKLMRFNTEGEKFEFGGIKYLITSIN